MSPSNKTLLRALTGAPKMVVATVALMEELVRVMTQEIDVVSKRKVTEHGELLKYKQKLAMDYRSNMRAIAAEPDMLKKISEEAKGVLREMAAKLSETAKKNALVLHAAVGATQQLIINVMAAVKAEAMPRQSYKNPATSHLQLGTYSPTCQPVALRRSV